MDELPKNSRNVLREKYQDRAFEDITRTDLAEYYFNRLEINLSSQGIGNLRSGNIKVLEVGSGNAEFLKYAKNQGVNIVGVDVRPRGDTNDSQVIARIEQLPFVDESFEVVFSNSAFDPGVYNQYPEFMMKEIRRVLKQGGIFIDVVRQASLPVVEGLISVVVGDKYEHVFRKL